MEGYKDGNHNRCCECLWNYDKRITKKFEIEIKNEHEECINKYKTEWRMAKRNHCNKYKPTELWTYTII